MDATVERCWKERRRRRKRRKRRKMYKTTYKEKKNMEVANFDL